MAKMNSHDLLMRQARINNIPNGWRLMSIGNVCRIRNDLRKPISVDERSKIQGIYPYYGPTGVLDYINEYSVEGSYALIGEDGDHFLKYDRKPQTLLIEGRFNVNNHAHIIQSTEDCTAEWFYHYFKHRNIINFLSRQGAGRYKLNKETLEKMPILVPGQLEQLRISELLASMSKLIERTEMLITAKEKRFQWLLSEYLSGRKRINNSSEKWIELTFGEIFKPIKVANKDNMDLKVLSVTKDGIVLQNEYFNKEIASEDKSKYLIVDRGTLVMSGLNFWMGSIDFQTICEVGIVSPAYKTFIINNTEVNAEFMRYFVRSAIMRRILINSSVQGASIVRRNLDMSFLYESPLLLPTIEEQVEIARILGTVEKEIQLQRNLVQAYRKQERGLMQNLLTGKWRLKEEGGV